MYRENYETWSLLTKARNEGHLFEKLKWPKNTDLVCSNHIFLYYCGNNLPSNFLTFDCMQKMQVKRLYSLLTIKESASSIPKNLEARRRLQFFTNSLFMKMPVAKPVREMLSFRYIFSLDEIIALILSVLIFSFCLCSVFTPYYSEIVLYSMAELLKKNEDGISILFYLQKIYPGNFTSFPSIRISE